MNDQRHNHGDDPFDELMRRALSEEAGRIEPADSLHEIQTRAWSQRKPVNRRPWAITAGAAVVGTAAAVSAFAVLNNTTKNADQPNVASSPGSTNSASIEPSSSAPTLPASPVPEPTQVGTPAPSVDPTEKTRATEEPVLRKPRAVPVYWLGPTAGSKGTDYRLYRTFNQVKGRPALAAVELMTVPKAANDPDYSSPWSGALVSSVRYTNDLIMIDFKQLPGTKLEPDAAEMAAQQLVYTVQGALLRTTPVQITEQGRASSSLFGVIDTAKPLSRAKAADVQAFVWIESPENNQSVKQGFSVTGQASAFEAHVEWRATNLKTKTVVKDFTTAKEGQKLSPYSFSPKLDSGEWLIEVYLTSAEDGRLTDVDSKRVVVK